MLTAGIDDWMNEQKKKSKDKISFENVCKALEAIINASEKLKSGHELNEVEIERAVLDIIASIVVLQGQPDGPAIKALCGVLSTILTHQKPKQLSVVEQLAKVVHGELATFNKKLQDQKYDGLRRRVTDQAAQLRTMSPGDKLDDPNLWNDFVQFMGELSNRFESPLPFKYDKGSLSKDPDMADFVTAIVSYCHAYSCFMALLMAAKGKFSEMGGEYKRDEELVDRKISCQKEDAVQKLAFLSDEENLTFLGRLPHAEGGKLTKILVVSRKLRDKSVVEVVRGSLNLSPMPELAKVESAAEKVSRQLVKLKLDERHQIPPGNLLRWMFKSIFGPLFWVQFVNETDFPMKIVSGTVGSSNSNLNFVQDIEPHSSYARGVGYFATSTFSTGGYVTIYLNEILNAEIEPPAEDTRVIEFALSQQVFWKKINAQEKTSNEFTRGQDTYNAMKSDEAKTLYWFDRQRHYMAKAEIVKSSLKASIWRFVIQDFDPLTVQD